MRSSYPQTPSSTPRVPSSARSSTQSATSLPTVPNSRPSISNSPLIPENTVPFPTQRLWAFALYGCLVGFCFYDWWQLLEDDAASLGLFTKWICIFAVYLYGIPQLRIPWMEWSTNMSTTAFGVHAVFVGMLMFRIPVSGGTVKLERALLTAVIATL